MEFRRDKYRRVVAATSALRKAQALVEANRSVKTWSEQMTSLIDAANELRLIKHEIVLSSDGVEKNPTFPNYENIAWLLRRMYDYLESLTSDFAEHKWELSERQREAEGRRELLRPLWEDLKKLKSVEALLAGLEPDDLPRLEAAIRQTRSLALEADGRGIPIDAAAAAKQARLLYEAAEAVALTWIAAGALGTARPRRHLPRLLAGRAAREARPESGSAVPHA